MTARGRDGRKGRSRSADHAALIEVVTAWERGREASVQALVEVGCRYPFEMLAPVAAAGDAAAVTELLGATRDLVSPPLPWSELLSALEAALPPWSAVLWASATAGRSAPWEALRPIAEVRATESVEPFQLADLQVVVALSRLSERPLVPAARRWLVVMEGRARLFSGDGWAVPEALGRCRPAISRPTSSRCCRSSASRSASSRTSERIGVRGGPELWKDAARGSASTVHNPQ